MIDSTKSDLASRARAPITCTRAEEGPRNHDVSSSIGSQSGCVGNRKTLNL